MGPGFGVAFMLFMVAMCILLESHDNHSDGADSSGSIFTNPFHRGTSSPTGHDHGSDIVVSKHVKESNGGKSYILETSRGSVKVSYKTFTHCHINDDYNNCSEEKF